MYDNSHYHTFKFKYKNTLNELPFQEDKMLKDISHMATFVVHQKVA